MANKGAIPWQKRLRYCQSSKDIRFPNGLHLIYRCDTGVVLTKFPA